MVNIVNTLQALSLQWILLMALGLTFEQGAFLKIVYPNAPVDDDFASFAFQYMICEMAILHGAILPEPENWYAGNSLGINYRYIIDNISMFNAQISRRCIDAFPKIYGRENIV